MMILRTIVLAAPILILGCSVPANPNVREQAPAYKEANGAGVSFTYSTSDFAKAEMSKQKKQSAEGLSDFVEEGFAPEHFCFSLKDRRSLPAFEKGPR